MAELTPTADATERTPLRARSLLAATRLDSSALAFGGLAVVVAAFMLYESRGTLFSLDDWFFWAGDRQLDLHSVFSPINGHAQAVLVLLDDLLIAVAGGNFLAWRISIVVYQLVFLSLFFFYVRRRLGGPAALLATLPFAFLGHAWLVLLMPTATWFHLGPLIAALAGIALVERGTRWADGGAVVVLLFGVFSSSVGLASLAAVIALLLCRREWRRLWIVAIPVVVYGVWYAHYRPSSGFVLSNVGVIPDYELEGASSGFGAYTGLGTIDSVLAAGLLALVCWRVWSARRVGARAIGLLVLGLAFWGLIAIARAPAIHPDEVRYLYTDAAAAVLIAVSFIPRTRVRGVRLGLVAVLALAFLVSNIISYHTAAKSARTAATGLRVDLFAIEDARATVADGFSPEADYGIDAGEYLAATADGHRLGFSETQVAAADAGLRARADATLAAALAIHGETIDPRSVARRGPGCQTSRGTTRGGGTRALVAAPGTTVLIAAGGSPVDVRLRRFADEQPVTPLVTVPPQQAQRLRIPDDVSTRPWHVDIRSAGGFRSCEQTP